MNINFTGKLTIDKSLYSLKRSNVDEIIKQSQKLFDNPDISNVIEDTTLFGRSLKIGDIVTVKSGDVEVVIKSKNEVSPISVLKQILFCTNTNNRKLAGSFKYSRMYDRVVKLAQEKSADI